MFFPGMAVIFGCVFGGYIIEGGNIMIILHAAPMEVVVIGGAAVGAFLIGSTKEVISGLGGAFSFMLKGAPYNKQDYLELLSLLYMIFKLAKSKGMLALEAHIEEPHESSIFKQFPKIQHDHHVTDFICDYLRMLTMGVDNPSQIEDLMNEELETHHEERHKLAGAFSNMGDGLPALGIVAAVLGVIKTMASISQPPEILGEMIGSALVGTFMGVFLAYGFVGPMANNLNALYAEEGKFYQCIKIALLSYLNGYAPAVSLEFARKTINNHHRPSFKEVEDTVATLPAPA